MFALVYCVFWQDSDVVGFLSLPDDEFGLHRGLDVGSLQSVAFPPNTLFRLQRVVGKGQWEAPGGVYPQRQLLVVSATYHLAAYGAGVSEGKVCGSATTLTYGSRAAYVQGLSDVLDKPLLTMEEKWMRDVEWRGHTGQCYSLRAEWEYVNGTPSPPDEGKSDGDARDANNYGKSPQVSLLSLVWPLLLPTPPPPPLLAPSLPLFSCSLFPYFMSPTTLASMQHGGTRHLTEGGGPTARKGGRYPPAPSRAHSLHPAIVPLTPSASFNGICN